MANPQTFGRVRYLNADTLQHTAWALRPGIYGGPTGVGVAGYQDFRVIQRQAGANMSVDVGITGVGPMTAWVPGNSRTAQGLYECTNIDWTAPTTSTYSTQINVDVSSNASGNPRLDQVVLEVLDSQHTGASAVQQIRVVAGTATVGATLDNRTGAAALPSSSILLADILVLNGAASIGTSDIRDRRPFATRGAIPAPTTALDQVAFEPLAGISTHRLNATVSEPVFANDNHDTHQSAVLMFLPRRIVSATRIRWKYAQHTTANTGNYNIGIYDASGRQIVTTGAVAFAGAANTWQVRSETISATTFEAGWYYVLVGWDSATVAGASFFKGVDLQVVAAISVGMHAPNIAYRLGAGGTTLPTTILSMTDVSTLTGGTAIPPVPIITLSVG